MDELDIADTWWMNLTTERRIQIYEWINGRRAKPGELPGQLDLLDADKDM